MAHYVLSLPPGRPEQREAVFRAGMWSAGAGERHAGQVAPGDLALLYSPAPEESFIGQATIATPLREWSASEASAAHPGGSSTGVLLSHVQQWRQPVAMAAAVQRIDPTGSNPLVQANAAGFPSPGLVRITRQEYDAVLSLNRGGRA
jgi:hypothetical protein